MTAHIHAENMRLYAEDAAETDKPWERWEVCSNTSWLDLSMHPEWGPSRQYRRKPRTININGHDVPEPLREAPKKGEWYWVALPASGNYCRDFYWENDANDKRLLRRGMCHATQEAAEAHGRALASFTEVA